MNLTLARQLLQERGYQLDLRERKLGKRTTCRVYATRGEDECFLCNFSELAFLSTATFQYFVAQLPGKSEGTS
jgi:hypothetical protein